MTKIAFDDGDLKSIPLDAAALAATDCAVVVTAHKTIDYPALLEAVPLLVDTRNALAGVQSPKLFRL